MGATLLPSSMVARSVAFARLDWVYFNEKDTMDKKPVSKWINDGDAIR